MSTLSGYIIRQTLTPLLASIGIALLVLLTERMLRLLDLVLDSDGGLAVLLELLAYLLPHYMALAMPAAFFLGVLLAFSRLHQSNELDAMGSAGHGLPRLLKPILILAFGLMLVSAVNFAVGQPHARYIYRAMVHEVAQSATNVYLQPRTFVEVKGVTFMAEDIQRSRGDFGGVFIYEEDDVGGSVAITAERGRLAVASSGERSILTLEKGIRLEIDPPVEADGSIRQGHDVLQFDLLQTPIDLVDQEAFRARGEDARELTLVELWQRRDTPPPRTTTDQMLAEFHDRLVRILTVFLLPFLAVPFAIGGRRTHQSYGIAAGLFILVAYNQLLSFGRSLASVGEISSLFGQWLPFLALATGSGIHFYRRAYRVSRGHSLPSPRHVLETCLQAFRSGPARTRQQHSE